MPSNYCTMLNYNDVGMFSIEPVKKTNVPSRLFWPSQFYYHLCSQEIFQLEISLVNTYLQIEPKNLKQISLKKTKVSLCLLNSYSYEQSSSLSANVTNLNIRHYMWWPWPMAINHLNKIKFHAFQKILRKKKTRQDYWMMPIKCLHGR